MLLPKTSSYVTPLFYNLTYYNNHLSETTSEEKDTTINEADTTSDVSETTSEILTLDITTVSDTRIIFSYE
mgnify:CR=1 FL=1